MTVPRFTLSLACLVALAAPAFADGIDGRYKLTGTHSAAPNDLFASEITIRKEGQDLHVTRTVTFSNGNQQTRSGTATNVTKTTLDVRLSGNGAGMASALQPGVTAIPASTTDMSFSYNPQTGECESHTWDSTGNAVATGRRASESVSGKAGDLLVYTKGGIKGLVKKGLRAFFESGVGVKQTLKVTDFLHVGLELETELLKEGELIPLQRKVLQDLNDRHVWLQTNVEGGIRLPFNAVIPVGGAANVSVGFQPGARLRYEVTDLYDPPAGITDAKGIVKSFKEIGHHVIDTTVGDRHILDGRIVQLPITPDKALDMQVGAERSVEGEMTVAINGGLGVGYDTSTVSNVLEAGASAHVGGFYRVRNWLRIDMTRLEGDQVRLHLTNGISKGPGLEARMFLGASLDTSADADWKPSATYFQPVVKAADGVVKSLLRFELKGVMGDTKTDDLDISYRFDLTKAPARDAYARAVRGDFTRAYDLAEQKGTGVERDFRVFELEERIYANGSLDISVLVDGKLDKNVEISKMVTQDGAGDNLHRVFRFSKERKLGLGAIFKAKWDERLYISMIRSTDLTDERIKHGPDGTLQIPKWLGQRSFRFRYDVRDATTRVHEMERLKAILIQLGLDDAAGLPVPERRLFRTRYGTTKARLEVDIAEWGIRTIMAIVLNEPEKVRQAYVDAYTRIHGKSPEKTIFDRKKPDQFVSRMNDLARFDVPDRGKVLKDLAEDMGWDLTMIGALTQLAPRRTIRVQATIEGKRISYAGEQAGSASILPNPDLHGH